MEMLQSIVEHIGCLKARAVSPGATKELDRKQTGKLRCPIVCHKCGQENHFASGCAASRKIGTAEKLDTLNVEERATESYVS